MCSVVMWLHGVCDKLVSIRGFATIDTSVDAKHYGASLSERRDVTWVGEQQYMYTLNYNSPNQNAHIH